MTETTDKPMKAYMCSTDDPEQSRVVFARSNGAAKFPYARELDTDHASVTVKRAPEYDVHAPGPVPISALLENGWYFECSCCLRRLSFGEDFIEGLSVEQIRAEADRQAPYVAALAEFERDFPKPEEPSADDPHPVKWRIQEKIRAWYRRRSSLSYMITPRILSKAALRIHDETGEAYCDARCEQEEMAERAAADHAHASAEREAERRWPGCGPYRSPRWPSLSPYVEFRAPGMKWPAGWRPEEDRPHHHPDDEKAWNAYEATISEDGHGQDAAQAA